MEGNRDADGVGANDIGCGFGARAPALSVLGDWKSLSAASRSRILLDSKPANMQPPPHPTKMRSGVPWLTDNKRW